MAVVLSYTTGAALTYTPAPAPPQDASPEAVAASNVFATAAGLELEEGLARGTPYPTVEGGRVVWVHPDGSRRLSANQASPRA
ncbi:hypothetical protein [Falsiroseomonas stagni]|uniref:hypothetical protein n=1 Tax=Falsiroseomonas stagni TaxID=484882 RepID=UPI0011137FF3|nr:hypothetical protein [Falsiroseomonas stagni]